tara:strand:+ start:3115 stop:3789 length:675 start_codon:yes stop_codon:yes gene_type:complete
MSIVNLIGHLIVDRIFNENKTTETLGGIANVWLSLLKLNKNLQVNVIPCVIGEALVVVNTNTNRRVGKALFNHENLTPQFPSSDWCHIAYINQIKDLNFLNTLDSTISADITKENPELCNEYLPKLDYLFLSKEDLFDDIKKIGKKTKKWVIAHDPSGSIYSNGIEVFEYKLPKSNYLYNINVLGAGDSFAAAFINEKITNSENDIHSIIKNTHLRTTDLIKNI